MRYEIINTVTGEVTYSEDYNDVQAKSYQEAPDGSLLYDITILD